MSGDFVPDGVMGACPASVFTDDLGRQWEWREHGGEWSWQITAHPVRHGKSERDALIAGRIRFVRDMCETAIAHEIPAEIREPGRWTDRHGLAQSVLNILDGQADPHIRGDVCSQCGRLYTESACGPTHAIIEAERAL